MLEGPGEMPTNAREARESESTMSNAKLPWWLFDKFVLVGAEEPPAEGGSEDGDGGEGSEEGTEGTEGGDDGSDSGKEREPEDTAGLKSALEKERRANAAKDRELKRFQKLEEDRQNADKTEVQRAKEDAEKAKTKAERLAVGFRDEKINNTIRAAANKAGFHDAEDAILAVDRESISWEQDDDDPARVTVDRKTVESAVKKLAGQKPHLVKSGTTDNGPTGGQFGGSGKGGNNGEADEVAYRTRYPSL